MNSKNLSTIFSNLYRNAHFCEQVKYIIGNLISGIPKEESEFYDYIEKFWTRKIYHEIDQLVEPISQIGINSPLMTIQAFQNNIFYDKSNNKKDCFLNNILKNLFSIVNWENEYHKIAIRLFFDILQARFTFNILKSCFINDKLEVKSLYNYIMVYFSYDENRINNTIDFILARNYSLSIYIISKNIMSEIITMITNLVCPSLTKHVSYLHTILILFSRVNFKIADDEVDKQAIKNMISFLMNTIKKETPMDYKFHLDAFDFLYNFCAVLFVSMPELQNTSFFHDAYKAAKSYTKLKDYFGPAHVFRAMIASFSNKKVTLTYKAYIDKYLPQQLIENSKFAECLLEIFLVFLYGPNYGIPELINGTNVSFQWSYHQEKMGENTANYLLEQVLNNSNNFVSHQYLLSRFFLQFSLINIDEFTNKITPILFAYPFIGMNREAILEMSYLMLKNQSFLSNENRQTVICLLLNEITQNLKKYFSHKSSFKQYSYSKAFTVTSFLETYNNYKNESIFYINDNCEPKQISISYNQSNKKIHKLKKIIGVNNPIFKKEPINLDCYQYNDSNGNDMDKNILLCLPFLIFFPIEDNEKLANKILPQIIELIFVGSPSISAMAIRLIEAFYIHKPNSRKIINNVLCHLIFSIYEFNNQTIYLLIYTINNILKIVSDLKLPLEDFIFSENEDFYEIFSCLIIVSLCSNSYHVRYLTYSLIKRFYTINKSFKVMVYMKKFKNIISKEASKLILKSLNIDENINIPRLSFKEVMFSKNNNIYQFYFAVFANKYPIKSYSMNIQEVIIDTLKKNFDLSIGICANIQIFIFNSISKDKMKNIYLDSLNFDFICHPLFSMISPTIFDDVLILKIDSLKYIENCAFCLMLYLEKIENEIDICNVIKILISYTKKIPQDYVENNGNLISFLLRSFIIIFKFLFNKYNKTPFSSYERSNIAIFNGFDDYKAEIYTFILKYLESNLFANVALSLLLSITFPPEEIISYLFSKLDLFDSDSLSNLLKRYPTIFFKKFTYESLNNKIIYYEAIMKQFNLGNLEFQQIKEKIEDEPKFSDSIFELTGFLIALSFAYIIDSSDHAMKNNSFKTLILLSIGAIKKYTNNQKAIKEIFKYYECTVSAKLSNFSLSLLENVSKLLSKYLSFCTDQLISASLKIMKNNTRIQNEIALLTLPWFESPVFDLTKGYVFKQTTKPFLMLTPYILIKKMSKIYINGNLITMLRRLLDLNENVPKIITLMIINLCEKYKENRQSMLFYLIAYESNEILELLSSFYKSSYWFYRNIYQLSNYTNILSNQFPNGSNYETVINFISYSLISKVSSSPDLINNIHYILTCFLLITLDELEVSRKFLLAIFPDFKNVPKTANEKLIYEFINSLSDEYKEKLGKEAIFWGLSCSNLKIAKRAITIYSLIHKPYDSMIIDRVFRASKLVFQVLHDSLPSSEDILNYISECFDLCNYLLFDEFRIDLFWFASYFISDSSNDFVLTSALKLMRTIAKNYSKPIPIDNNYKGILLQYQINKLSNNSAKEMYLLILEFIKNDNLKMIFNSSDSDAVVTLILILLSRIYGIDSLYAYTILATKFNEWKIINSLIILSLGKTIDYNELTYNLACIISKNSLNIISKLLACIGYANGFTECLPFYEFAVSIIQNFPEYSDCFCFFPNNLQEKSIQFSFISITGKYNIECGKELIQYNENQYPIISDFKIWDNFSYQNLFSSLTNVPPMCFLDHQDNDYSIKILDNIYINPFEEYDDIIFQAQRYLAPELFESKDDETNIAKDYYEEDIHTSNEEIKDIINEEEHLITDEDGQNETIDPLLFSPSYDEIALLYSKDKRYFEVVDEFYFP